MIVITGCGQQKSAEKTSNQDNAPLKVATNATFVPFEFKSEENGDFAGYEMDLIRAVGKKLNRDVQIQDMAFNGLIPALQSGELDVAASGMAITKEERKKKDKNDNQGKIGTNWYVVDVVDSGYEPVFAWDRFQ